MESMDVIRLDSLPGGGINGDDAVVEQINVVTFVEGGKDGVEKERESWGSKVGFFSSSSSLPLFPRKGLFARAACAACSRSLGGFVRLVNCCMHVLSLTLLSFASPLPPHTSDAIYAVVYRIRSWVGECVEISVLVLQERGWRFLDSVSTR